MGQSETFDHTADLGLRIHGSDLDDLFRTAATGLFQVIVANAAEVRPQETLHVALTAQTIEELLVHWLNELIYQAETGHRFFSRFDVRMTASPPSLTAEIHGEPVDPDRHVLDHEVKAATHHGVRLEKIADGWVAEVILDI
jgi:SHS2 domain-containing protein